MISLRPNIEAMAPYVPGEQPAAGTRVIKLNTNENPYPTSPKVVEALRAEMGESGERLRLYSDPKALALRQAAAEVYGCGVENVLHGKSVRTNCSRCCFADLSAKAKPSPIHIRHMFCMRLWRMRRARKF